MGLAGWLNQKRFSLRTLILAMTAACLLLGAWAMYVDPFRRQAQSLEVVHHLRGDTQIVAAEGSAWQRWLVTTALGEEQFVQVTGVDLSGRDVDDRSLAAMADLRFLQELNLDRTFVTDAGSSALQSFPELRVLSLRFTKLTDKSAEQIGSLQSLGYLYLTSTRFTDAAVPHLEKLDGLDELYVRWTSISDAGAERLRRALPHCDVFNHSLQRELVPTDKTRL